MNLEAMLKRDLNVVDGNVDVLASNDDAPVAVPQNGSLLVCNLAREVGDVDRVQPIASKTIHMAKTANIRGIPIEITKNRNRRPTLAHKSKMPHQNDPGSNGFFI